MFFMKLIFCAAFFLWNNKMKLNEISCVRKVKKILLFFCVLVRNFCFYGRKFLISITTRSLHDHCLLLVMPLVKSIQQQMSNKQFLNCDVVKAHTGKKNPFAWWTEWEREREKVSEREHFKYFHFVSCFGE